MNRATDDQIEADQQTVPSPSVTEKPGTGSVGREEPKQSDNSAFISAARQLGPIVGALAVLSLTLPGLLGTMLLVYTAKNAGSPSNFYDPGGLGYHRLLGTWDTGLNIDAPVWPEGDRYPEVMLEEALESRKIDPNTPLPEPVTIPIEVTTAGEKAVPLRVAIEPAPGGAGDDWDGIVRAVRAVPMIIDTPPGVSRSDWQPWGVIALGPDQRRVFLEPTTAYKDALPTISLTLQPSDDVADDTLRSERAPADDNAIAAAGKRHTPPIQTLILNYGVLIAALIVAVGFAITTGSAVLPTYALSFAVGVFFGPLWGSAIALAGATGGAVIGYCWGLLLARRRVSTVIEGNPRAHIVRAAIIDKPLHQESFVVALVRFPPNSPFALTNLVMSSVGVRWVPYVLGTAVGIAPRTLFAVALGVIVGSVADAQTAGGTWRVVVGAAVGIAVFYFVYRLLSKWAKDALRDAASAEGQTAPA